MAKDSFLKRNWKLIVNILTLVALAALVYFIRDQIVQTFEDLWRVNLWILALLVPLQILNYHAQTKMYQGLFGLVGNKLKYWFVFRVALELNFVNHVFPSGGVSGISFFGVRMRSGDITATKATLVQVMKLLLLFISFEILLIGGLLLMALHGQANDMVILAGGAISTLLVIGTFAFVAIVGSERRIHATFTAITRGLNRMLRFVRRGDHPETISTKRAEGIVQDLHGNYKVIEKHYKELQAPFWWALVNNATAILSIYAVYVAFGEWVNLGAIILAYAVANFAGLVSVLPGGVGIYEVLMTGVLAAAGVSPALSLPVTVMYRVISTVLQVPVGYVLYHQSIRKLGKPRPVGPAGQV